MHLEGSLYVYYSCPRISFKMYTYNGFTNELRTASYPIALNVTCHLNEYQFAICHIHDRFASTYNRTISSDWHEMMMNCPESKRRDNFPIVLKWRQGIATLLLDHINPCHVVVVHFEWVAIDSAQCVWVFVIWKWMRRHCSTCKHSILACKIAQVEYISLGELTVVVFTQWSISVSLSQPYFLCFYASCMY